MVVPYFVEHGGGVLINVSGRGGRGDSAAYTSAYAATKAGVMVFSKSLAAEHKGDRVSVLVFMPGMVDTDFYVDMKTSPRLAATAGNVRLALDAFPLRDAGSGYHLSAARWPLARSGSLGASAASAASASLRAVMSSTMAR